VSYYCFEKDQVWNIRMRGLFGLITRRWLKGNQKVMLTKSQGKNTRFKGRFCVHLNSEKIKWELEYGCSAVRKLNKWYIRPIHDTVDFLSADEANGKFYWWRLWLSNFDATREEKGEDSFQ